MNFFEIDSLRANCLTKENSLQEMCPRDHASVSHPIFPGNTVNAAWANSNLHGEQRAQQALTVHAQVLHDNSGNQEFSPNLECCQKHSGASRSGNKKNPYKKTVLQQVHQESREQGVHAWESLSSSVL